MGQALGWISMITLTTCALPQLIRIIRTKQTRDISILMWWTYFIGHLFALGYAISIWEAPLLIKYGINILISLSIIYVYYKQQPNRENADTGQSNNQSEPCVDKRC